MKEMSFEDSLKKLEEYVKILEKGELSLDESIKVYSDAMKLSAECSEKLENARLKISAVGVKND